MVRPCGVMVVGCQMDDLSAHAHLTLCRENVEIKKKICFGWYVKSKNYPHLALC